MALLARADERDRRALTSMTRYCAGHRVERELDVALADDAEVPRRANGDGAQQLVLGVVQRLRRRHDDRLARVDPHGIEVLHVAHGDAVVGRVTDDLVLDLLPAAQALLDQHLWRTAGEGPPQCRLQISAGLLDDAAALAAEREAAAQHDGQAEAQGGLARLVDRVAGDAACRRDSDLVESLDEATPVLGIANRGDGRAEHADPQAVQHAAVVQARGRS